MDIDCDGTQGGPADDGRCGNSDDTQSITSFADTVREYGKGVQDLDAKIHPYVVFGNVGDEPGFTSFDPQEYGIEPLSVMAVVCGDKLVRTTYLSIPINKKDGELTEIRSTESGVTRTASTARSPLLERPRFLWLPLASERG